MDSNLKAIFNTHDGKLSDKWTLYINEWDDIFSPYQNQEITLLEIGIQNGGSLEIFAKYFPKAKHLMGCDIDEACRNLEYSDPRISLIIGDINSDPVENRISEITPSLDIIIDDGSHQSRDIIQSFSRYFKKLNVNGLYLIEDLHASYWDFYEGGLHNPYSAISFFKRLVDITNFEHWQNNQSREAYLAPFNEYYDLKFDEFEFYQIHSIKFINSLCVIQKRPPEENTLGKRVIVGSEELISQNSRKFDGTTIHDLPTGTKEDSHLDVFSLIAKTVKFETENTNLNQTIQNLNYQISEQAQLLQHTESELADQKQSYHQLEGGFSKQETTIQELENECRDLNQEIQQLNDEVKRYEQSIHQLHDEVKQYEQTIHQLHVDVATGSQQIHELHLKEQELDQHIVSLKNEVLFYALSKSWRLTRPLRKMMNLLRGK